VIDVKRTPTLARPFTLPERVALVTKPRAVLPAGSTSSPFLRIVVTSVARTGSSTREVSEPKLFCTRRRRIVPAGIVISRSR